MSLHDVCSDFGVSVREAAKRLALGVEYYGAPHWEDDAEIALVQLHQQVEPRLHLFTIGQS
jgi:hypothetical protein